MLEKLKLKAELSRVTAAKDEISYMIAQKLDEVERLKAAIEKQEAAEQSLQERMNNLEEKK